MFVMKICSVFLLLILITSCSRKTSDNVENLIVKTQESGTYTVKHGDEVAEKETVKINKEVLKDSEEFSAELLGDRVHFILHNKRRENNGSVWSGKVEGERDSFFIVTEYNGILNGDIYYSKGRFQLKQVGKSVFELRRLNHKHLSSARCAAVYPKIDKRYQQKNSCEGEETDGAIDVAVYYTEEAKNDAGGVSQIESEAYHAVAVTNESFINSSVNARLNIVVIKKLEIIDHPPTILDILNSINRAGSSPYTHPTIVSDKAQYSFDIGMTLVSEGYPHANGVTTGLANMRKRQAFGVEYDSAYSMQASVGVCARGYATSNLTFPHELGHIMGLDHDCGHQNPFGEPVFTYSHGYSGSDFRTIMASYKSDTPQQPRPLLPYWSSPDLLMSGNPMGTNGNSACEANAVRSLNEFANRIANYECENNALSDVLIKDGWGDDGSIPTILGESEYLFNSVDVWLRRIDDGLANEHQHQNPEYGQSNFIYVKLRNGGEEILGTVEVYVANANTNFTWGNSGHFSMIGSKTVTVPANSTQIAMIPWDDIPDPSIAGAHYCLYVRWVSNSDPMQSAEGHEVWKNVRDNNNIAWKNLNVVDEKSIPIGDVEDMDQIALEQAYKDKVGRVHFTLNSNVESQFQIRCINLGNDKPFDDKNHAVIVKFDHESAKRFNKFAIKEKGIEILSEAMFRIKDAKSILTFHAVNGKTTGHMDILIMKTDNHKSMEGISLSIEHYENSMFSGGYIFKVK